jgi:hypothetical protein
VNDPRFDDLQRRLGLIDKAAAREQGPGHGKPVHAEQLADRLRAIRCQARFSAAFASKTNLRVTPFSDFLPDFLPTNRCHDESYF